MKKMLKLSDEHYIIIDDSEDFTETDWYYDTKQKSIRTGSNNHVTGGYKQKITHSNQPIELLPCKCRYGSFITSQHPCKDECQNPKLGYNKIKPLSLSEVEEAINGDNSPGC